MRFQSPNSSLPPLHPQSESMTRRDEIPPRGRRSATRRNRAGS